MNGDPKRTAGEPSNAGLLPIGDGDALAAQLGIVADMIDHLSAAATRLGAPRRPDLFGDLVEWQEDVRRWSLTNAVVQEAERAVRLAEYRQRVEAALARLAGRPGLSWTRLDPNQRSSFYFVVCDGRELGTVDPAATRYVGGRIQRRTWRATPVGHPLGELGPFRTIRMAAEALAQHAGLSVAAAQRAGRG
jgi:hypothetical protein